ncbi:unnamed protein product [Spodoptera littoralis]|uniref:Uncharacterized protein n=1 Tax=Spodoptera littoralis TaxID=7109 RepID=A0A9P0IDU1_SPOLI|nr:unnamed protein product [Spodoptera littoralis]CAH1644923.1 unnamed protein product [Spodoptera littoralis]
MYLVIGHVSCISVVEWASVPLIYCLTANEGRARAPGSAGQKEGVGQAHAFRSKSFKKPRPCHWCHQPVHNTGSCCRETCDSNISCNTA